MGHRSRPGGGIATRLPAQTAVRPLYSVSSLLEEIGRPRRRPMFAFDWLADPSAWAGLLTLIVLEIVLGIDNLVFVAILADKRPARQRDHARLMGLGLALVMRLCLLAAMSWLVTLTRPLFEWNGFALSWRDLILVIGGAFLLFKATLELHERLEADDDHDGKAARRVSFWLVVAQIVILDAVFSLD